ncbi:hypothetical protein CLIB1444_09S00914 [[Candida] jaroonii]|uniref:Uncharacterized protein n=1 Tax=[Candida] jaroonii TaxID=467808 RepID=A0ACA9YBR9_9ASCO|nr:hypothetical protein CLIB1444_09S00914 [[Candida] jaroonii]
MAESKRKLSIYNDDFEDPPPYNEEVGSTINSGTSTPTLNEDLVAAEALTQLNGTPPPTTPLSNLTIEERQHPIVNKVSQVSKHPLVTNAFKYYEDSKVKYPHFNYAAGIVERAAIPVVAKIEDNLNNRHMKRMTKRKSKKRKVVDDKNETKKRLQFCLHILRLANDQINNQVINLQQKIVERETRNHSDPQSPTAVNTLAVGEIPSNVIIEEKQDKPMVQTPTPTETEFTENNTSAEAEKTNTEIITTVKKIIHVISNFKTSTLTNDVASESNELKSTIRDIILKLPSQVQQNNCHNPTQTNDRIFLFAKESLDMIGRLTKVFNEQLQKAEDWINSDEQQNLHGDDDSLKTPVPERINDKFPSLDNKIQL